MDLSVLDFDNPFGRPQKEINIENLKKLLKFRPTLEDTAAWFEVSADTIERRIKEITGKTFREYRDVCLSDTKQLLVQKALSMAIEGDRKMLVLALKNYCGWEENPTQSNSERQPVYLTINAADADL